MNADMTSYYQTIMEKIVLHKDFGIRNPVDIGVECGYSEEAVLKMLKKLSEKVEAKEKNNNLETEQNKYYFLFSRKENFYIVSVDIRDWSTQVVKKLSNYQHIGTLFDIKKNIFAKVDFDNRKTIEWENLETNQSVKFFTNSDIKKILLVENGIIALTSDQIILFKYDGSKIEKNISTYADVLLEEDEKIYSISEGLGDFYVFSPTLEVLKQKQYNFPYEYRNIITDYENGKLSWYLCKEEVHIFSSYSYYWKKYTESTINEISYNSNMSLSGKYSYAIRNCICGIRTKNYKLLQKKIYTADEKYEVCYFDRKLGEKSGAGQVVGIFDKDIFIGIGIHPNKYYGDSYANLLSESDLEIGGIDEHFGDAIIKIDLNNEREPVILPVDFSGIEE